MNDFQITNITISNSDDLGRGTTMRKIGYSGTFSDSSHIEGFVMMSEDKFFTTNYADLKNIVATQIIKNLGGNKNE
ncbi:hypothetical protein ABHC39_05755 [Pediococcus acidilactici]|uniref:hypothetical protein n=1 Tax=Pediococcus acidilactici TaxID=1254 RepID=UPI0001BEDDA2|nr:hypothetical protein [Pediococcus acidilactici]ARW24625.1 hypothetical protein S100424_01189 [Pediococcus acidilactici]ARW26667.1 hypothetical protein S100313_01232 [Pediococcus acidilactici]ARW28743.1 hypothetical protein S101189_01189 [Pediococcus acidilactici]EFA26040.1 hypothetical protein HMPREF9024_01540 [Pediococcus acidilactici 7_4]MDB8867560.1 hypothetical protein [Pediococcus acidilactici]